MTKDFVIGKDNTIPWHIPGELTHFKDTTMGHCMIMGRKTYESIGHPLPGRRNLVVTRNAEYSIDGCEIFTSLDNALAACTGKKIFIIGGEQLFTQSVDRADTLILSIINRQVQGDTWFPRFSDQDFVLHRVKKVILPEPYRIRTYKRIVENKKMKV